MTPASSRGDRLAFVVYICAVAAVGFSDFYIRRNPSYAVTAFIPGVVDGSYEAPFIYRPLAPFLFHAIGRLVGGAPLLAFEATRMVTIAAGVVACHWLLRTWYGAAASLGATLGILAILPLTFTNSWQHPDTFIELTLFAAGCALVARGRDAAFAAVLALAAFNRETSVFLLMLWALVRLPSGQRPGRTVAWAAGLALLWLAVFVGTRWVRGYQPYHLLMLGRNLAMMNPFAAGIDPRLRAFAWFWLFVAGIPGVVAARGAWTPGAPPFFRHGVVVAGAFLVFFITFAAVVEPRALIPVFPLLAPGALRVFVDGMPAVVADSVGA